MKKKSNSGSRGRTQNPGWFPKGHSGNLKGRSPGSRSSKPSVLEVLLEKTVTTTEGGIMREITLEEALQQRTFRDALEGKRMAVREILKMIEKREKWIAKHAAKRGPLVSNRYISPDPDNADAALVLLGIAIPDPDRADDQARRIPLLLASWAVEAALRRARRKLTDSEWLAIKRCTSGRLSRGGAK